MLKRCVAGVLVALALSGCGRSGTETLVVGVCDPLAAKTASECVRRAAVRDYSTFAVHLAERTGLEVTLRYYAFDPLLEQAIRSGEVNAAIGKVWSIRRGSAGFEHPFVRLADLTQNTGANELAGVFLARTDRDVGSISALTGRRVAIGPETAYEKSHAAQRALADVGADPADFRVLDGCGPVTSAVLGGSVDAGVVSSYVVEFGGLNMLDTKRELSVIGRTAGMPFITIAVSADVDETTRRKLRDALFEISGQNIPDGLYTAGVVTPRSWEPAEAETR